MAWTLIKTLLRPFAMALGTMAVIISVFFPGYPSTPGNAAGVWQAYSS
jgi:hypothetical protein